MILQAQLDRYNWYHSIRLNDEVATKGYAEFRSIQEPVEAAIEKLPIAGKRVLDVGCRDGLFSFEAERLGASEVMAIDNNLSRGAVEIVLPYLNSRVQMHEMNLYDLSPEHFGRFDVVLFPGVLYHLRYPMWGLNRLRNVLSPNGWLLIETAIFLNQDDLPLLYCPIDHESPYEPTSVTFFNVKGLRDTLSSLGIVTVKVIRTIETPPVGRAIFLCQFRPDTIHPTQQAFWEGRHTVQTDWSKEEALRIIHEKDPALYRR